MPTSRPSCSRLASLLGALLLVVCEPACAPPQEPHGDPLWGGAVAPRVLVEGDRIALPPTLDGNRFVAGWWPWRFGERIALGGDAGGARLQVVTLEPRRRTLSLALVEPPPAGGRVRVRAAGRDLGTVPLADPLTIDLPADLPRGASVVELVPEGGPLDVVDTKLRPALPAGEVAWEGADLVQGGVSRVELVVRPAGRGALVGTLDPPARPGDGQRASLLLEDDRGRVLDRFDWSAADGARRRRIRLPAVDGPPRVRVVAEVLGQGPPVRWRDLRWTGDPAPAAAPEPPPQPVSAPFPRSRVVVVYVMDALRADAVGHLGAGEGASPTFDRLAAQGVTYRRHRSVAPSTLPSTQALFTGATPPAPTNRRTTLAELFRDAGWRTALFSANVYVSDAYGLDRGFGHVEEEVLFGPEDEEPGAGAPYNDSAEQVHAAALAWLDTLGAEDAAFLYLHTMHPHNPYDPPREVADRFTAGIDSRIDGSTDTLLDVDREIRSVDAADRARLAALYAANLAYNDRELSRFLEELERRIDPRELLLVLTSDHGEELFDHGGVLHGYTLYEEQVRVPLVLWAPGRLEPRVVDAPTSTLDLHAALAVLAGGGEGGGTAGEVASEGRSLLPHALGDPAPPSAPRLHFAAAPTVRGGIFSVRDGRFKLVLAAGGAPDWGQGSGLGRSRDPEYLFDLADDPEESRNLAGRGGLREDELRGLLLRWVEGRGRGGGAPEPEELDDDTRRRLEALGYLR